ncbi:beta-N-acetylhexosaminidase [Actinosynnema pretiosum subsp. pretiosum]|uniref:beta-N-acetylhexosaminidase n=1 Tax=Actinosynnema pretiosum subsp. pretiosum TaxID=103721 RepID=A0AA45L1K6_9PSEU|nr:Beta-hexosaminidase [Actinosynnema pretiosum subsp. pretiosum]QUF01520.1 beta-N-acetylhexosaminidase [Actinosynnema pretiosum subsp. pretiosum]
MTLLPEPVSVVWGGGTVPWSTPVVRRAPGPAEGYRISISAGGVHVDASDDAGEFYAHQTLRQLRGPDAFRAAPIRPDGPVPVCEIVDHPEHRWRGCMIDVARHFLPKHDLLRYVDLLAAHKLNVLHLHLTDDQGWRVESERFPRLHEVGGWRPDSRWGDRRGGLSTGRPHGGCYSRDDLREVVAYAAARHVTVVPEIDVPGHSQAAIAAYPELGVDGGGVWTDWGVNPRVLNGSQSTVDFYRAVFDELLEVFPGEVVGFGGDEAPGGDGRFVRLIAEHLVARGRRPYGWDEVLDVEGLPEETVIAAWRSEEAVERALERGLDVVACPERHAYLDYRQSEDADEPIPVGTVLTTEDVRAYRPVAGVLGAQANIWTEHLDSPRRLDYAAFPRLSAFAEVVWNPAPVDGAGFAARLGAHLPRLAALGVEYRPPGGPLPWQRLPGVPGHPR